MRTANHRPAFWPLRAAPAGPFPGGTGTLADPFNGMCMTLAADRTTVVAWTCSPGASTQQWTSYSDGTLRTGGRCLDVTGPRAGARAKVAACTGAASQKWVIGQVSSNDFGLLINTGTGAAVADPGGSTTNGTPAGHGTRPRRPQRPVARLLPPLHGPVTRRQARGCPHPQPANPA